MKNRIISTICLLMVCSIMGAFEWQHQDNEELRADMIQFAEGFASRAQGTPGGKLLKSFVARQKKLAQKDPYAWIGETKDLVIKLEMLCPPVEDDFCGAAAMRRDILLLLDYPLHCDNHSDQAPRELKDAFEQVSQAYRAQARTRALALLDGPAPQQGRIQVIKIYNCGLILRTSQHTIGVDIKWEADASGAEKIARSCDLFVLSHPHLDHYSDVMINALAAAGKTAVIPGEDRPMAQWEGKKIVFDEHVKDSLVFNGIVINSVPGYQGNIPNNAYMLSFDGHRVLLPGENDTLLRYVPLGGLAAPDLVIFPSWNNFERVMDIVEGMRGYCADKVTYIPEHENELFHPVNHRESYRELFSRADRLGNPSSKYPHVVLLDIGEGVVL